MPVIAPCAAAAAAGVVTTARKKRHVSPEAAHVPTHEAGPAVAMGVPVALDPTEALMASHTDAVRENTQEVRENTQEVRRLRQEVARANERAERWKRMERAHHDDCELQRGYSSPASSDSSREIEAKRVCSDGIKAERTLRAAESVSPAARKQLRQTMAMPIVNRARWAEARAAVTEDQCEAELADMEKSMIKERTLRAKEGSAAQYEIDKLNAEKHALVSENDRLKDGFHPRDPLHDSALETMRQNCVSDTRCATLVKGLAVHLAQKGLPDPMFAAVAPTSGCELDDTHRESKFL